MDNDITDKSSNTESTFNNAANEAHALLATFRSFNRGNQQPVLSGTLDFGSSDDLYKKNTETSIIDVEPRRVPDRDFRTQPGDRHPEPDQPHVTIGSGRLYGSILSPRPQAE